MALPQARDRTVTLDDSEEIVTLFRSDQAGGTHGPPIKAIRLILDEESAQPIEYWVERHGESAPDAEDEDEAGMPMKRGDAPREFFGIVGGVGTIQGLFVRGGDATVSWEPIAV